ncbi:fasciclin domain-containing protein [Aquimarina sp. W85]|uniref:fasciclin domain-containing protein n=1 Tax=Aquimarina rhodophyticola TaxID=3342246 RepID=UPI00366C0FC5
MKIISNIGKFAIIGALVLGIASCSDDDDGDFVELETNLVVTATADSELTSLVAALAKAELVTTLNGSGPFTVLAPTDAAFSAFLEANNYENVNDIPVETLKQVLLNHVIPGEIEAADLKAEVSGYATTASTAGPNGANISIYYEASSDVTFNGGKDNGGATVTTADISASNGIIHKVDAVIGLPDIVSMAKANANFSTLVSAVVAADLVTTLQSDGPFTVFAPNNASFSTFLSDNEFSTLEDVPTETLTQTLLNHALTSATTSSDLSAEGSGYVQTASTAGPDGENISMFYDASSGVIINGGASNKGAQVETADIVVTNGIIHQVDAVINLPNVTTFAAADTRFSTLVTALTEANLVGALQAENGTGTPEAPFTIFAPTNTAFDELAEIPTGDALTDVLLLHVIEMSNVTSADLTTSTVVSLGGNLDIDATAITVKGEGNAEASAIILADVQATNGVIHAIDQVLLPNPNL